MTIQPDPSGVAHFNRATNGKFYSGFLMESPLTTSGGYDFAPFVDMGPKSQGATFEFSFRSIDPGDQTKFKMYYGAAADEREARDLIQAINAEVFAFAKPSHDGECVDTPNVFIVAFTRVGGEPIQF